MQGSSTFSVEATIGSVIPPTGKLLVVNNGAYGARIAAIAERLKIPVTVVETMETSYPLEEFTTALSADPPLRTWRLYIVKRQQEC